MDIAKSSESMNECKPQPTFITDYSYSRNNETNHTIDIH